MKPFSYYNEFDPKAAAWLRELINAGLLGEGEVDERSIAEVQPEDLMGFTQCHFFAGIGGWPLALKKAGWPADRPVWSGSCPCQPFSTAGMGLLGAAVAACTTSATVASEFLISRKTRNEETASSCLQAFQWTNPQPPQAAPDFETNRRQKMGKRWDAFQKKGGGEVLFAAYVVVFLAAIITIAIASVKMAF